MKFISSLVLIALLSYVMGMFLPWWTIAIAAFVVCWFIPQRGFVSFLTGFLAIFLLWGIMSFMISSANHDILAHRVSELILKKDSPTMLILLTGLLGGLVAGFAALSGSFAHKKLKKR
ncbi:MAG: hypothetical protein KIT66_06445 [Chitinophagaceae bacterium]|nr:hypothetical protein [Chitinophagaceae bacterium]